MYQHFWSAVGFKHKHSSTQCMFTVQEVVNYYRDAGTDIYAIFHDASKEFDRVNYVKLFTLLLKKACPLECILLAFI